MLLEERLISSHLKTLPKCIFLKTIPGGLVLLCFLRSRLCVAVVDNRLYAIGGTSAAIHIGLVNNEQYTPFGYETIPEFPPGIILPLSLIVTTVVIVINGLSKSPKSFINCPFSRLANLKSHKGPSF